MELPTFGLIIIIIFIIIELLTSRFIIKIVENKLSKDICQARKERHGDEIIITQA